MRGEEHIYYSVSAWPPIGSPLNNVQREDNWEHFDNSVNALSFGFVATAILISMFLVIAIFERFIRPTSPTSNRNRGDLESQTGFNQKLCYPSPKAQLNHFGFTPLSLLHQHIPIAKSAVCSDHNFVAIDSLFLTLAALLLIQLLTAAMNIYANGVSVLMPGDNIPTFIAHPAPAPCQPERVSLPHHQHNPSSNRISKSNSSSSSTQEDST